MSSNLPSYEMPQGTHRRAAQRLFARGAVGAPVFVAASGANVAKDVAVAAASRISSLIGSTAGMFGAAGERVKGWGITAYRSFGRGADYIGALPAWAMGADLEYERKRFYHWLDMSENWTTKTQSGGNLPKLTKKNRQQLKNILFFVFSQKNRDCYIDDECKGESSCNEYNKCTFVADTDIYTEGYDAYMDEPKSLKKRRDKLKEAGMQQDDGYFLLLFLCFLLNQPEIVAPGDKMTPKEKDAAEKKFVDKMLKIINTGADLQIDNKVKLKLEGSKKNDAELKKKKEEVQVLIAAATNPKRSGDRKFAMQQLQTMLVGDVEQATAEEGPLKGGGRKGEKQKKEDEDEEDEDEDEEKEDEDEDVFYDPSDGSAAGDVAAATSATYGKEREAAAARLRAELQKEIDDAPIEEFVLPAESTTEQSQQEEAGRRVVKTIAAVLGRETASWKEADQVIKDNESWNKLTPSIIELLTQILNYDKKKKIDGTSSAMCCICLNKSDLINKLVDTKTKSLRILLKTLVRPNDIKFNSTLTEARARWHFGIDNKKKKLSKEKQEEHKQAQRFQEAEVAKLLAEGISDEAATGLEKELTAKEKLGVKDRRAEEQRKQTLEGDVAESLVTKKKAEDIKARSTRDVKALQGMRDDKGNLKGKWESGLEKAKTMAGEKIAKAFARKAKKKAGVGESPADLRERAAKMEAAAAEAAKEKEAAEASTTRTADVLGGGGKVGRMKQKGGAQIGHGVDVARLKSDFDILTKAVTLNTSKVGITPDQADAVTANTAKTGISKGQANALSTNSGKTGISSTQAAAIAANTSTNASQANAISANTSKNASQDGTIAGKASSGHTHASSSGGGRAKQKGGGPQDRRTECQTAGGTWYDNYAKGKKCTNLPQSFSETHDNDMYHQALGQEIQARHALEKANHPGPESAFSAQLDDDKYNEAHGAAHRRGMRERQERPMSPEQIDEDKQRVKRWRDHGASEEEISKHLLGHSFEKIARDSGKSAVKIKQARERDLEERKTGLGAVDSAADWNMVNQWTQGDASKTEALMNKYKGNTAEIREYLVRESQSDEITELKTKLRGTLEEKSEQYEREYANIIAPDLWKGESVKAEQKFKTEWGPGIQYQLAQEAKRTSIEVVRIDILKKLTELFGKMNTVLIAMDEPCIVYAGEPLPRWEKLYNQIEDEFVAKHKKTKKRWDLVKTLLKPTITTDDRKAINNMYEDAYVLFMPRMKYFKTLQKNEKARGMIECSAGVCKFNLTPGETEEIRVGDKIEVRSLKHKNKFIRMLKKHKNSKRSWVPFDPNKYMVGIIRTVEKVGKKNPNDDSLSLTLDKPFHKGSCDDTVAGSTTKKKSHFPVTCKPTEFTVLRKKMTIKQIMDKMEQDHKNKITEAREKAYKAEIDGGSTKEEANKIADKVVLKINIAWTGGMTEAERDQKVQDMNEDFDKSREQLKQRAESFLASISPPAFDVGIVLNIPNCPPNKDDCDEPGFTGQIKLNPEGDDADYLRAFRINKKRWGSLNDKGKKKYIMGLLTNRYMLKKEIGTMDKAAQKAQVEMNRGLKTFKYIKRDAWIYPADYWISELAAARGRGADQTTLDQLQNKVKRSKARKPKYTRRNLQNLKEGNILCKPGYRVRDHIYDKRRKCCTRKISTKLKAVTHATKAEYKTRQFISQTCMSEEELQAALTEIEKATRANKNKNEKLTQEQANDITNQFLRSKQKLQEFMIEFNVKSSNLSWQDGGGDMPIVKYIKSLGKKGAGLATTGGLSAIGGVVTGFLAQGKEVPPSILVDLWYTRIILTVEERMSHFFATTPEEYRKLNRKIKRRPKSWKLWSRKATKKAVDYSIQWISIMLQHPETVYVITKWILLVKDEVCNKLSYSFGNAEITELGPGGKGDISRRRLEILMRALLPDKLTATFDNFWAVMETGTSLFSYFKPLAAIFIAGLKFASTHVIKITTYSYLIKHGIMNVVNLFSGQACIHPIPISNKIEVIRAWNLRFPYMGKGVAASNYLSGFANLIKKKSGLETFPGTAKFIPKFPTQTRIENYDMDIAARQVAWGLLRPECVALPASFTTVAGSGFLGLGSEDDRELQENSWMKELKAAYAELNTIFNTAHGKSFFGLWNKGEKIPIPVNIVIPKNAKHAEHMAEDAHARLGGSALMSNDKSKKIQEMCVDSSILRRKVNYMAEHLIMEEDPNNPIYENIERSTPCRKFNVKSGTWNTMATQFQNPRCEWRPHGRIKSANFPNTGKEEGTNWVTRTEGAKGALKVKGFDSDTTKSRYLPAGYPKGVKRGSSDFREGEMLKMPSNTTDSKLMRYKINDAETIPHPYDYTIAMMLARKEKQVKDLKNKTVSFDETERHKLEIAKEERELKRLKSMNEKLAGDTLYFGKLANVDKETWELWEKLTYKEKAVYKFLRKLQLDRKLCRDAPRGKCDAAKKFVNSRLRPDSLIKVGYAGAKPSGFEKRGIDADALVEMGDAGYYVLQPNRLVQTAKEKTLYDKIKALRAKKKKLEDEGADKKRLDEVNEQIAEKEKEVMKEVVEADRSIASDPEQAGIHNIKYALPYATKSGDHPAAGGQWYSGDLGNEIRGKLTGPTISGQPSADRRWWKESLLTDDGVRKNFKKRYPNVKLPPLAAIHSRFGWSDAEKDAARQSREAEVMKNPFFNTEAGRIVGNKHRGWWHSSSAVGSNSPNITYGEYLKVNKMYERNLKEMEDKERLDAEAQQRKKRPVTKGEKEAHLRGSSAAKAEGAEATAKVLLDSNRLSGSEAKTGKGWFESGGGRRSRKKRKKTRRKKGRKGGKAKKKSRRKRI